MITSGDVIEDSTLNLVKILKVKGININRNDLHYSRRFADKYPEVGELVKQRDISWNKIKQKYLIQAPKQIPITEFGNNVVVFSIRDCQDT